MTNLLFKMSSATPVVNKARMQIKIVKSNNRRGTVEEHFFLGLEFGIVSWQNNILKRLLPSWGRTVILAMKESPPHSFTQMKFHQILPNMESRSAFLFVLYPRNNTLEYKKVNIYVIYLRRSVFLGKTHE